GLLGAAAGRPYDLTLFEDLYHIAYQDGFAADNQRALRFGLAVDWEDPDRPAAKCYFDLHAGGFESANARLQQFFDRVGLAPGWKVARNLIPGSPRGLCRGVGVDISPTAPGNLRLYVGGERFSVAALRALLRQVGREDQYEALNEFSTLI